MQIQTVTGHPSFVFCGGEFSARATGFLMGLPAAVRGRSSANALLGALADCNAMTDSCCTQMRDRESESKGESVGWAPS